MKKTQKEDQQLIKIDFVARTEELPEIDFPVQGYTPPFFKTRQKTNPDSCLVTVGILVTQFGNLQHDFITRLAHYFMEGVPSFTCFVIDPSYLYICQNIKHGTDDLAQEYLSLQNKVYFVLERAQKMWRDFLSEYICPKGLLGEKSISGEEIEEKFDQLVIKKVKDLEKSIKKCR